MICGCFECEDNEADCGGECDREYECQGCEDRRIQQEDEEKEDRFNENESLGRY